MDTKTRTFYSHDKSQWEQAHHWIRMNQNDIDILGQVVSQYDHTTYQLDIYYKEKERK